MIHPITPPPELVQQWISELDRPDDPRWQEYEQDIADRAAQYGADQELEACCAFIDADSTSISASDLRAARRPKPPSLKEQALAALNEIEDRYAGPTTEEKLIRRALEQLPND